ncbi:MAG: ArsR/SmtB family transcription factor [Planctomycetota bacterium]|jgi:DNA-binding transcriptional ArsR family regulator
MLEILNITKALSDENRVRALMMLSGGEMCVCQIIEMLGLAPSTVSKHMSILRQAGLVQTRKNGRWIFYRLADQNNPAALEAIQWLAKHLKEDPVVAQDENRLEEVKQMDADKISECYKS